MLVSLLRLGWCPVQTLQQQAPSSGVRKLLSVNWLSKAASAGGISALPVFLPLLMLRNVSKCLDTYIARVLMTTKPAYESNKMHVRNATGMPHINWCTLNVKLLRLPSCTASSDLMFQCSFARVDAWQNAPHM